MAAYVAIDLLMRDSKFQAAMARTKGALTTLQTQLKAVSQTARLMLLGAAGGLGAAVKVASDYEETISKFRAVFKDQSAAAEAWADETSKSINRAKLTTLDFMATLQNTFVPFGFARKEARELSQQLTQLAYDLASFNNTADADTIRDLQSALVGNHETVRKYGIVINETTIQQQLLRMGIRRSAQEVTQQEKVLARLAIIMDATKDAQGDAARTADSFANQMKGLKGDVIEVATALGQAFLPAAKSMVGAVLAVLVPVAEWTKAHAGLTAGIAGTAVAVLGLTAVAPRVLAVAGVLMKLASVVNVAAAAVMALAGHSLGNVLSMTLTSITGKVSALAAGFTALVNPATLAMAAIAAAGLAAYAAIRSAREELAKAHRESQEWADIWRQIKGQDKPMTDAGAVALEAQAGPWEAAIEKYKAKIAELRKEQASAEGTANWNPFSTSDTAKVTADYEAQIRTQERMLARAEAQATKYRERARFAEAQAKLFAEVDAAEEARKSSPEGRAETAVNEAREELVVAQLTKAELVARKLVQAGVADDIARQVQLEYEEADAQEKARQAAERKAEEQQRGAESFEESIRKLRQDTDVLTGKMTEQQVRIFDLANLETTRSNMEFIYRLAMATGAVRENEAAREAKKHAEKIADLKREAMTQEEINAEKAAEIEKAFKAGELTRIERDRLLEKLNIKREEMRLTGEELLAHSQRVTGALLARATRTGDAALPAPGAFAAQAAQAGDVAAGAALANAKAGADALGVLQQIYELLQGVVNGLMIPAVFG